MVIQNLAVEKFEECWSKVVEIWPSLEGAKPEFKIVPVQELKTSKERTSAGIAYCRENKIVINQYFLLTNTADMLNDTIPHEVAHIVCSIVYPFAKQAHGPEWKSIMRNVFGLQPTTYHNYDTSSLKKAGLVRTKTKTRHVYSCSCSQHEISKQRHNKIMKEGAKYRCNGCHDVIKDTGRIRRYK